MYFIVINVILPIINALVTVQIHRNAVYHPLTPCAFIRNMTWSHGPSMQSCIWECDYEHDCQTAIYFHGVKTCSMFSELCTMGAIQTSENVRASVICHRKNHNPVATCLSTVTTVQGEEKETTLFSAMAATQKTTTTSAVQDCMPSLTNVTVLLNLTNINRTNYITYPFTYTARATITQLIFSFRMDTDNWSLDTVSAKETASTSVELLSNGDFRMGNMSNWSFCNPNGVSNNSYIEGNTANAGSGTYYCKDGSTGAMDYLYCNFSTTVGSSYGIKFELKSGGVLPNSAVVYIGP